MGDIPAYLLFGSLIVAALYGLLTLLSRRDVPLGRKLAVLAAIVITAGIGPALYGVWDLYTRSDIERGKKALWWAAFVLTLGLVAAVYGLIVYSRSEGAATGGLEPRGP